MEHKKKDFLLFSMLPWQPVDLGKVNQSHHRTCLFLPARV